MNGVLLLVWMFVAVIISLVLMASVSPLVGFAFLAINGILLRIVQASLPGAPEAIRPPQAQGPVKTEGQAEFYVSRMGFDAIDDKAGISLYVDGVELGAIDNEPAKLYIKAGAHTVQAKHFLKPPEAMLGGGKLWAKMMNSIITVESKPLQLEVRAGARIDIICKREQDGFSKPRLVLLLKEEGNQAVPETKRCPKCDEEIRAAAIICRFCRYEYKEPA